MSADYVLQVFGTCVGVGLLLGFCIAIFNAWHV